MNGLVHQGSEVGKVMCKECELDIGLKSITELFLPTCISGNVFFSIAGQVKELPLISIYSLVALGEVTELTLLPVHNSLRNEAGTKGSLEIRPSDDRSSR